MPVYFFAQFKPLADSAEEFRDELLRVVQSTGAEAGCRSIRVFESLRQPVEFAIHSEWEDEAAVELHTRRLHTAIPAAAEHLLDHPVQGMLAREIIEAPDQTH